MEENKKDYDLWYKDVGEEWVNAHDDKGNLIREDYWGATDKINNAKYQKDFEQKAEGKPNVLKKIQMVEKKLDKILGKLTLVNIRLLENTKSINQQAYNIILSDINWLINNN